MNKKAGIAAYYVDFYAYIIFIIFMILFYVFIGVFGQGSQDATITQHRAYIDEVLITIGFLTSPSGVNSLVADLLAHPEWRLSASLRRNQLNDIVNVGMSSDGAALCQSEERIRGQSQETTTPCWLSRAVRPAGECDFPEISVPLPEMDELKFFNLHVRCVPAS